MSAELSAGNQYEALQYVQSFVARKKKTMGPNLTSKVVFHGAQQLAASNSSSGAGTLLKWFIEDGAGVDHSFKTNPGEYSIANYCDVQRLVEFLTPLSAESVFPIVDAIYAPLHLMITKAKLNKKSGPLANRLNKFEEICANAFAAAERWLLAFKSYVRLGKIEQAGIVLLNWSAKGYATEKPMFFARGLMYLLAEGKVEHASSLLSFAKNHVQDNIDGSDEGGGANSAPLAVWHVATILTDLANFPPNLPRVDKTKLFGLLYTRYTPLLMELDNILLELFLKAGEVTFNFRLNNGSSGQQGGGGGLLQGMLGGAGQRQQGGSQQIQRKGKQQQQPQMPPGGLDMDQMLRMIDAMQNQSK